MGGVSLRIKRRVGFLGGIKRRGDKYRAEGTVELSVGLRAEGAPNAIESVFTIVDQYSVKIHDTVGDLVSLTHLHDLVVALPYAYFSLQCHTSVRKLVEILPQQERFLGRNLNFS